MELVTTTAVAASGTALKVKLLNKDGVDITTSTLLSRVTFTSSSDRAYLNGNVLTLFAKNDTTTVTATFHTYKYENGVELNNLTATGVVTAVDVDATVAGAVTAWTIAKTSPDYTKVVHTVAAEDNGYQLFAKLKSTTGTTANADIESNGANASKFKFTSSDNSVLIVNGSLLTPIKAGSAVVVVSYDNKVVDAITITVAPKRAATEFVASANSFTLSTAANDYKDVDFKLNDQLGDKFAFNIAYSNIDKLTGSATSDKKVVALITDITNNDADNKATIRFSGNGVAAGTYFFKITVNNLVQYITVEVKAPTTQLLPSSYKLNLSASEVDLKLSSSSTSKSITFDVYGYADNGMKMTKETIGTTYVVKVTNPDGVETTVDATGEYPLTSVTPSAISGSSIVKSKTGIYKVTLAKDGIAKDVTYFTVTDTQVAPIVSKVESLYTTATDKLAAVKACFDFSLNGTTLDENFIHVNEEGRADVLGYGSGSQIFVKSVMYREHISGSNYIDHTITVGYTVTNSAGNTIN